MSNNAREIVVQVTGSGIYHKAFESDGVLLTAEGCNLDDAGSLLPMDSLPPDVPHSALCERCMKPPQED